MTDSLHGMRTTGAYPADLPTRLVVDSGITAAVNAMQLAEPHLGQLASWRRTQNYIDYYRDDLDAFTEDLQLARARIDPTRTTPTVAWERLAGIAAEWKRKGDNWVTSLENEVAAWDRELTAAATPPAPTSDAQLLEARLANARTDAMMVLDRANGDELVPRMRELARGADQTLAYLMLATTWPATYLRARGDATAPLLWEQERHAALGATLTADALTAHQRLAGLPHARKAAQALKLGHNLFVQEHARYFTTE